MQQIIFLSPRDMRKNRADAVHMMKTCSGFAANGVNVTLVTPRVKRRNESQSLNGLWSLYGLDPTFRIVELPTYIVEGTVSENPLVVRLQRLVAFGLYLLSSAVKPRLRSKSTVIYGKCYTAMFSAIVIRVLLQTKWTLIFEQPVFFASKKSHRFICRNVDAVTTANPYVASNLKVYGIQNDRVCYVPFYSDIEAFDAVTAAASELRTSLGLPLDRKLVVYTGKMAIGMPEIEYIMHAARITPEVHFVIVGGREHVVSHYVERCVAEGLLNVTVRGFQTLENIYRYVAASDVLVSYYPGNEFASYQQVPAKLFVYACAERPVVVADLPTLRAIIPDNAAFFVTPDAPPLLSATLRAIIDDKPAALRVAKSMRRYAEANTLESYSGRILDFVTQMASGKAAAA